MSKTILLKSGDVLFTQGDVPGKIFILNQGEMEVLLAPREYVELDSDIIIDKSLRVSTLKGKSMVLEFSENLVSPYRNSLRALSDCQIIEYPLDSGGFRAIASKDFSGSINMLRQLFSQFMFAQGNIRKRLSLNMRLCQIDDNLSLLYHLFSEGSSFPEITGKSGKLYDIFSSSGGKIPETISADFLLQDNGRLLKKKYEEDIISDVASEKHIALIKNILRVDPRILGHLFKANPEIPISSFNEISRCCGEIFENSYRLLDFSEKKITFMMDGDDGWAGYFSKGHGLDEWMSTGRVSESFFKNFIKLLDRLDAVYFSLSGKRFSSNEGYEILKSSLLNKTVQDSKNEDSSQAPSATVSDLEEKQDVSAPAVISTGLQKSIYQIFEFSMVDKEFQDKFLKLINDFKAMKNPINSDSESRKLRRHITQMYWKLYQKVFIKTKTESSMSRPVKLMMNYGFVDDEMLEHEQLKELNELSQMKAFVTDIPVIGEYEFLSAIYSGKEEPSITEMGLNYEKYLKELERPGSKQKNENLENSAGNNINIDKVIYEINQRVASTVAVCSGATSTAFPILTSQVVKGSLLSVYQSKEIISAIVKKIMDIDFSAFYRETVLKMGSAREIIKEEVIPYFIIIPSYGTRTLLWQENTGNNRRSRGRIVIPAFFIGDLEKSLMHTIACFRWEMNRTIKGGMWGDPIEGGITGEYFDYVNTYKQNSKLSPEAKEKIKSKFKSLRTNRDSFADDYILWLAYEREGIMKLNNVVREMFFKHIPFKKDIREQLENMPAFTKYATRYKNVQNKEVAVYERKFKKYQDESGKYPDEIEKYLTFLNK